MTADKDPAVMAAIYSTPIIRAFNLLGVASYVVPAGYVLVVRDIDILMRGGVPSAIIQAGEGGGPAFWYLQGSGATEWHQWQGRQVFNAGETFYVDIGNQATDVRASGYLLVAP